jgi:hypothetical protein
VPFYAPLAEDKLTFIYEQRLGRAADGFRTMTSLHIQQAHTESQNMSNQAFSSPQHTPSQQSQYQPTQETSFRVFKPELDSVAHDPLDPTKRYHDGIFVERNHSLGTGTMF